MYIVNSKVSPQETTWFHRKRLESHGVNSDRLSNGERVSQQEGYGFEDRRKLVPKLVLLAGESTGLHQKMAKTVAKISYSNASVGFNMRRFRLGLSASGRLGLSFTDVARVIVERAYLPLKNGGSMAGNGSFEREKRKKKRI